MASKHQKIRVQLEKAAQAGLNVLMEGPHGTGKTSLAIGVAGGARLRLKYYSASTLDPFVDLVGLPVPTTDDEGNRSLTYHRHVDINEAEIVFFDELNRAHMKVLNAVLEMIQFRSINGEPLPKLRAVFAACNPADGTYEVQDLDPALVDRFHMHVLFGPEPDKEWFSKRFNGVGLALYDWWVTDLDGEQQRHVSPASSSTLGCSSRMTVIR
ncbi:AAA family ATPase [Planctomycetota bacterium]